MEWEIEYAHLKKSKMRKKIELLKQVNKGT